MTAIKKEFNYMHVKKVWEIIKKIGTPKGRRTIECKLKIKRKRFLEPESLHADAVKFRVSISTKVLSL
jgi:hypothetical protein